MCARCSLLLTAGWALPGSLLSAGDEPPAILSVRRPGGQARADRLTHVLAGGFARAQAPVEPGYAASSSSRETAPAEPMRPGPQTTGPWRPSAERSGTARGLRGCAEAALSPGPSGSPRDSTEADGTVRRRPYEARGPRRGEPRSPDAAVARICKRGAAGVGGLEALEGPLLLSVYGSGPATSRTPPAPSGKGGQPCARGLPALHGPPVVPSAGGGGGRYWEGHRAKHPKPSQPFQSSNVLTQREGPSGNPGRSATQRRVSSHKAVRHEAAVPHSGRAPPSSPQPQPHLQGRGRGGGGEARQGEGTQTSARCSWGRQTPGGLAGPPHQHPGGGGGWLALGGAVTPTWRRTVFHHLSPLPP